ncbi:MAG TPA: HEAT repeat domain-containing protein [Planctomycetaceae bacterium]|nr:HEAT repeat domain-containing protein [Planctomycetaceae bacterium]
MALRVSLSLGLVLGASCVASAVAGPIDPEVDSAMEQDPLLPSPAPVPVFPERLKPLWIEALAQPEADLKRLAAASIARAHRGGMPDLAGAIPHLAAELDRPDQDRIVRLACAEALVVLDARQAAAILRRHAASSLEIGQMVEPALAAWGDPPAGEMWLARLGDPGVRHQSLLLAIDGLGAIRELRADTRLLDLALSSSAAADVRLCAARALSRIRESGLEGSAAPLLADKSPAGLTDRLVAASLLAGHRGPAAQALLNALAVDDEPAVAAIALRRLLEIDPDLVLPLVSDAIRRDDPHVRRLAAEALIARATAEHVALVGTLLDDVHPDVRRFVRGEMIRMAGDATLAGPVIEAATGQLTRPSWRGQEQAIFILVAQAHRPAIPLLVERMESERSEVLVTAAWALRRLEARDVLPEMLDRATRVTAAYRPPDEDSESAPGLALEGMDRQLGQLFEAFGQMNYGRAEPLMRRYVPKTSNLPPQGRSRAIWALGKLYAGRSDERLAREFGERVADVASLSPEFPTVRYASAISLGRMKAETELPVLREFSGRYAGDKPGVACLWAIEQITGEPMPPLEPVLLANPSFLTPLE